MVSDFAFGTESIRCTLFAAFRASNTFILSTFKHLLVGLMWAVLQTSSCVGHPHVRLTLETIGSAVTSSTVESTGLASLFEVKERAGVTAGASTFS